MVLYWGDPELMTRLEEKPLAPSLYYNFVNEKICRKSHCPTALPPPLLSILDFLFYFLLCTWIFCSEEVLSCLPSLLFGVYFFILVVYFIKITYTLLFSSPNHLPHLFHSCDTLVEIFTTKKDPKATKTLDFLFTLQSDYLNIFVFCCRSAKVWRTPPLNQRPYPPSLLLWVLFSVPVTQTVCVCVSDWVGTCVMKTLGF